jgi:hypothetical protein
MRERREEKRRVCERGEKGEREREYGARTYLDVRKELPTDDATVFSHAAVRAANGGDVDREKKDTNDDCSER